VRIAVIGAGFIGSVLGRGFAGAGHDVVFGARTPGREPPTSGTTIAGIAEAIEGADAVVLAIPGAAVAAVADEHGTALAGMLVVDATNRMGATVANARADLPAGIRYARAFNTLGGEVMAAPEFADGPADMFFSASASDRDVVGRLIAAVGLRPMYLGEDREELVDALFRVWIALAMEQGLGRRLALRAIQG
jgi:predicted dinucleotide-binding enzyme